jgi:hypothetical protein
MHEALRDFLLELPTADTSKAFFVPIARGQGDRRRSGLSMAFARIMQRAKVRGEVNAGARG